MIYPLESLRKQGFKVHGYFYNPNVHPLGEHAKRMEAVHNYSLVSSAPLIFADYGPKDFFQAINQLEEKLHRCPVCWYLRLKKTAKMAKENGFEFFSTTLLVSPYQDQDALKKIGSDIAKEEGVNFHYEDFRVGFRKAHDEAKAKGIYCQKYCGCIYSEIERCKK
jgi:epoxyqueuosine reductase